MASAKIINSEGGSVNGLLFKERINFVFFGSDVQDGAQITLVEADVDLSSTVGSQQAAIAAAVRSKAATIANSSGGIGVTVPTNQVNLTSYSKA
jgi:hypothetical protein